MTVTLDLIIQIIAISVGIGSLVVLTYLQFLIPRTTTLRLALVIVLMVTINYFVGIVAHTLTPESVPRGAYIVIDGLQLSALVLMMFFSLRFVEVLGRPRYRAMRIAVRVVLTGLVAAAILHVTRPSVVTIKLTEICAYLFSATLWVHLLTVDPPSGITRGIRIAALLGLGILIPSYILQRTLLTDPGFHVVDAAAYLFVTMSSLIFSVYYLVDQRQDAAETLSNIEFQQKFNLTQREVEVMELLIKAYSYKEIGAALGISMPTVKTHITRIYKKTGTEGKSGLKYVILRNSGSVIQKST